MKLPPNIPTALILTFLFSLQVPLRLAAPLSHDKLFPEPVVPLVTLSQQPQVRYERIDNGRIATRHSNPNSNRDFPSLLPDSLSVSPSSTGSPTHPPGRLLGRLQKRESGNSFDAAAIELQLNQLSQLKRHRPNPQPAPKPRERKGRYPRPLKHLFAHAYHSKLGRGVIDSDSDFYPNNFPIKRTLSESADDDLPFNLFDGHGPNGPNGPPTLLKMMTVEPTITINSTSIQRLGPGPGAGSNLAAMSMGGAVPRPRELSGENKTESNNETSFMSRRINRIEKRREEKNNSTIAGRDDDDKKRSEEERREREEDSKTGEGEGSKRHGRYHKVLASVAAAA